VSEGGIVLGAIELKLAWNVRGDPAQPTFVSEANRLLSLPLPLEPNTTSHRVDATLLWLGPRSWLFVSETDSLRDDFDPTRIALNAVGGALFDVSASYVEWKISGPNATRALNKTCPLDFHPRAFGTGRCAQSVLGHVSALFYKPWDESAFIVMVPRSFAADAWRELCASAETDGYQLARAAPFQSAA
jgi:sarcosine oxidase, subunit gamma